MPNGHGAIFAVRAFLGIFTGPLAFILDLLCSSAAQTVYIKFLELYMGNLHGAVGGTGSAPMSIPA